MLRITQNRYKSLWHYNLKNKKVTRLTDDMTSEDSPSFSSDGHYLYFTSERDFNLSFSSYEFDYLFNKATRVYTAAVNEKVAALTAITSDEVSMDEDTKNKKAKGKK